MFDFEITKYFNYSSAPCACPQLREDRILNYVWINKEPPSSAAEYLCDVPLNYIDKAYENAGRYPDTQVDLWVDFNRLNQSSHHILKAHTALNAPPNVRLRNLREIPAYDAHAIYTNASQASIWNKVDLARFLVLSHQFETTTAQQVFYADFDIEDVSLDSRITQERLADTGMAFAKLERGEMIAHGLNNNIQHAYIAMDRSRQPFLDQTLLPQLSLSAERNNRVVRSFFDTMYTAVRDLPSRFDNYHYNVGRIFTDVAVPKIGYDIPANPDYDAARLCVPGFIRR